MRVHQQTALSASLSPNARDVLQRIADTGCISNLCKLRLLHHKHQRANPCHHQSCCLAHHSLHKACFPVQHNIIEIPPASAAPTASVVHLLHHLSLSNFTFQATAKLCSEPSTPGSPCVHSTFPASLPPPTYDSMPRFTHHRTWHRCMTACSSHRCSEHSSASHI